MRLWRIRRQLQVRWWNAQGPLRLLDGEHGRGPAVANAGALRTGARLRGVHVPDVSRAETTGRSAPSGDDAPAGADGQPGCDECHGRTDTGVHRASLRVRTTSASQHREHGNRTTMVLRRAG